MTVIKICQECGINFPTSNWHIKNGYGKYCSRKCTGKSQKDVGQRLPHGKGKLSPSWKGDKAGYHALHIWLYTNYGKANKCEANKNHKLKRYEWSNISRTYKRDINDWQQLCISCHRKYDIRKEVNILWL